MFRRSEARPKRFLNFLEIAVLFCLTAPGMLFAQSISGTIQDPSGAVIPGARIEITGAALEQVVVLLSDDAGKFSSPELKPGSYSLRVTREGFEPLVKTVDVQAALSLQLTLKVAGEEVKVAVSGKSAAFVNSDPVYRQLRNVGLGQTFRLDHFTLISDAATFRFEKGTLTFLAPVEGVVTGAIFVGEAHFSLKPATPLDARELSRRTGASEVNEDFSEAVFRFSRDGRMQFFPGIGAQTEPAPEAAPVLSRWRGKLRQRREVALGFSQSLLQGETIDNVDADMLSAVYNPAHPEFFNAYIGGKKHKDLRFFLRKRVGAIPQLDSPEEVGLINCDPEALDDGIWYLAHLKTEYEKETASSGEDRRLFATHSYKIETVIAKNRHLFSTATIGFASLVAGERVLKFGLLPNLRVTRVSDSQGKDLFFVQESRKEDGSFYAILSGAPPVGEEQTITVEYAGDHVLEEAGEGSFYVAARSSWYPNLNGFGERAVYDLTFKVPKSYKVISVGELRSESIQGDLAVSQWITSKPVAVAGFNYGEYLRMDISDEITGYKISGYYMRELPFNLKNNRALQSLAPRSMTKHALEEARGELQLCSFYFGRSSYDDLYVTEQPDFAFGQSWPNLVYLPISAYTDSTQRWLMFGTINSRFTGFVQEVTPHEVAHQWWGHTVGWASYHDQWLSEGFAEFSAGLFVQQGIAGNWHKDYTDFWERLRERLLEKNNYGISANDAGPLWMGLRLISPRTERAYQEVTYPKGAYVLEMLRSIMYDNQDKDKAFIAMMHDFVETHRGRAASTESFKAIAEKHITKSMDLQKNGRLDWFFDEWVYGTQLPRYHFEYQLSPAENGKVKLHMTVTQSDVDEHFAMLVPVFGDFGTGMIRLGQVAVTGNSTRNVDVILPSQPRKVALNVYKEILER